MDNVRKRLEALHPEIDQILQISGSPALSLGVLYRGDLIYTAHFGRRDAEELEPPNDDTTLGIHWVASLTKVIAAAAIAKLVHDKKLHWNNSEPLMKKSESTFTATYLSAAKPFGHFVYSQWNYALIDDVVKEAVGISLCDYIEQSIFRPLNMTRSSFDRPQESDNNVAHAHCTHDDGTATRKPDFAPILVEAGCGAGAGARCSIKDYMVFLQALLSAFTYEHGKGADSTPGSVFALTKAIFTPQVGFGPPHRSGIDSAAYCMGLYRTKLPGYLSFASPNLYSTLGREKLLPYGTTLTGTEIFHHSGTGPGHLGAMYLIPKTQSAVVSLTNSQPLMDSADFAAQLALSVLLREKVKVDFVKMAKLGSAITLRNYEMLKKVVSKGKTNVPPTKPLAAYKGDYYNAIHNFVLSVTASDSCLNVKMQRRKTGFTLFPYDGDTFYWPVDREEETCTKTMWGFIYKDWHLFRFGMDCNGEVESLAWRHDPYLSSPEVFKKTSDLGTFARL